MRGRKWTEGPGAVNVTLHASSLDKGKSLVDYVSGIYDTLDGSHGVYFTYLPIVYQDDCQVCQSKAALMFSRRASYMVHIEFLPD